MSRNFWKPSKSISWCRRAEMEMRRKRDVFVESLNWTLENTHIILIKFVSRCRRRPAELLENIFELLARVLNGSETRECKSGWIIKIDRETYNWRDLGAAGTRSATIYPTGMPSETKKGGNGKFISNLSWRVGTAHRSEKPGWCRSTPDAFLK